MKPPIVIVLFVAVAVLIFSIQLGLESRALQKRSTGPSLDQVSGMLWLAPTTRSSLAPEREPDSSAKLRLSLPTAWTGQLGRGGSPYVFLDGQRIPFSPRPSQDRARAHAHYSEVPPKETTQLIVRCGSEPCGAALAVLATPALETALWVEWLLDRPRALLLGFAAVGLFLAVAWNAANRWRAEYVPPAMLGAGAGAAWFALDLAGTRWSWPCLAAELAAAGTPLLARWLGRVVAAAAPRWERTSARWRTLVVLIPTLVVLGGAAAAVLQSSFSGPSSTNDHWGHLQLTVRLASEGYLLPHFLYHLMLAALAGFSTDVARLVLAAQVLLTCCVLAKLWLSSALAHDLMSSRDRSLHSGGLLVVLIASFLAAPLPNPGRFPQIYLGQLTGVVWHNPTVILAVPFAVAVFRILIRGDGRSLSSAAIGSLLLAVSILAKPNFALALLPVLAFLYFRGRLSRGVFAVYAVPAVAALLWQNAQFHSHLLKAGARSAVRFAPLEVWRHYSDDPFASLILSLAFPLAVVAWFSRVRLGGALSTAWLITIVAITEFALLADQEAWVIAANYYWGIVPAIHLLFVVSICELLLRTDDARAPARFHSSLSWTLLALHLAAGVVFYWRSLRGLGYEA